MASAVASVPSLGAPTPPPSTSAPKPEPLPETLPPPFARGESAYPYATQSQLHSLAHPGTTVSSASSLSQPHSQTHSPDDRDVPEDDDDPDADMDDSYEYEEDDNGDGEGDGDSSYGAARPAKRARLDLSVAGSNVVTPGIGLHSKRPRFTEDEERAMVRFLVEHGRNGRPIGDNFWRVFARSRPAGTHERPESAWGFRYRRQQQRFERMVSEYLQGTAGSASQNSVTSRSNGSSAAQVQGSPTATSSTASPAAAVVATALNGNHTSPYAPRPPRPRYTDEEEEGMARYIAMRPGKHVSPANEVYWREYAVAPERDQQRSSSSYAQKYYNSQKPIEKRVERILQELKNPPPPRSPASVQLQQPQPGMQPAQSPTFGNEERMQQRHELPQAQKLDSHSPTASGKIRLPKLAPHANGNAASTGPHPASQSPVDEAYPSPSTSNGQPAYYPRPLSPSPPFVPAASTGVAAGRQTSVSSTEAITPTILHRAETATMEDDSQHQTRRSHMIPSQHSHQAQPPQSAGTHRIRLQPVHSVSHPPVPAQRTSLGYGHPRASSSRSLVPHAPSSVPQSHHRASSTLPSPSLTRSSSSLTSQQGPDQDLGQLAQAHGFSIARAQSVYKMTGRSVRDASRILARMRAATDAVLLDELENLHGGNLGGADVDESVGDDGARIGADAFALTMVG